MNLHYKDLIKELNDKHYPNDIIKIEKRTEANPVNVVVFISILFNGELIKSFTIRFSSTSITLNRMEKEINETIIKELFNSTLIHLIDFNSFNRY